MPHDQVSPVHAVLFDYGLVLSGPPDPRAWAHMVASFGRPEEDFHAAYWAHRHDYDRGTLTGAAYWHAVAVDLAAPLDAAQLQSLFADDVELWTQPNQPMIDWATRLQRNGVRIGVLSNIGDAIAEGVCAKLAWLSGFNHCTWSHALFMAKPEPAIYTRTAEALHVSPCNLLFIDDREENVVAAQETGMQAIQYTTHQDFERTMRERGFAALLDVGGGVSASAVQAVKK